MDLPRVWGPFLCASWRRRLLGGLEGQPMASGTGVSIGVYVLCLDPAGEDLSLSTPRAQARWFSPLPHLCQPLPVHQLLDVSLLVWLKSAALARTRVRILLSLTETLRKVFPLTLIGNQNRNLFCIQLRSTREVFQVLGYEAQILKPHEDLLEGTLTPLGSAPITQEPSRGPVTSVEAAETRETRSWPTIPRKTGTRVLLALGQMLFLVSYYPAAFARHWK